MKDQTMLAELNGPGRRMKPTLAALANSSRITTILASMVLAGTLVSGSSVVLADDGAVLYKTGFERPQFVADQPVAGQDGWLAKFSPAAAIISRREVASGHQALEVNAADLDLITAFGYYGGVYRPEQNNPIGDLSQTPHVLFQVDVRLDGDLTPPAKVGDLMSANFSVVNPVGLLAEIYISSDGNIWSDDADGLYEFGQPERLGRYHRLGLDLNYRTGTLTFYVDGEKLGSKPIAGIVAQSTLFKINLIVNGAPNDPVHFPDYNYARYVAHFDNLLIVTIQDEDEEN